MRIGKFNANHPPMTCFERGRAMTFGEFGSSLLYEFRRRGSREIMISKARFFQTSETEFRPAKRWQHAAHRAEGCWGSGGVGCKEVIESVAQGAKARWVSVGHGTSLGEAIDLSGLAMAPFTTST